MKKQKLLFMGLTVLIAAVIVLAPAWLHFSGIANEVFLLIGVAVLGVMNYCYFKAIGK